MKDFMDKLSSYNLFNYLLPGILFAVFSEFITPYRIIRGDLVVTLFLCYFIGMCVSRVGSLVVEPILKRLSFVHFAPYSEFIQVSQEDPKLEVLSETNNTYRTLCSLFLSLCLMLLLDVIARRLQVPHKVSLVVLCVFLMLLFAYSYRKQTAYIANRIQAKTHPVPREGEES